MSYAGDVTPVEAYAAATGTEAALLVDVRTRAEWTYVGVPVLEGTGHDVAVRGVVDLPRRAGSTSASSTRCVPRAWRPGGRSTCCAARGCARRSAAEALTAAGLGPAFNVLDGFEGPHDAQGHRTVAGWKVAGLPWRQG